MGVNIGLDFGTTYTKIAFKGIIDGFNDGIVHCAKIYNLQNVEVREIPSIAAVTVGGKAEELSYGFAAQDAIGDEGVIVFRGFKLLIDEENLTEELKNAGYTKDIMPSTVAEGFITYALRLFARDNLDAGNHDEHVDSIIVCMPLIWERVRENNDNGNISVHIKDTIVAITQNAIKNLQAEYPAIFNDKTKVDVTNEPSGACAFLVENYKTNTGNPFTGEAIIVDVGGGTLDILRAKVEANEGHSIITPLSKVGRGFNTRGQMGVAGIEYMKDVLKKSIAAHLRIKEEEIIEDSQYSKAFSRLENFLISETASITGILEAAVNQAALGRKWVNEGLEGDFTYKAKENVVPYGRERIPITVKQLTSSFSTVVAPVLEEALKEICSNEGGKKPALAVVGGFGNFCLTRLFVKHILGSMIDTQESDNLEYRYYETNMDGTTNEEIGRAYAGKCGKNRGSKQWRYLSIALGAGLIANKDVTLKKTSPISLGLRTNLGERWCFKINTAITPGVPSFISREDDGKKVDLLIGTEPYKLLFRIEKNTLEQRPDDAWRKFFLGDTNKTGALIHFGACMNDDNSITIAIEERKADTFETRYMSFNELNLIISKDNAPAEIQQEGDAIQ